MKDKAKVQLCITELHNNMEQERIPEHSKFLLKIDTERLQTGDYDIQEVLGDSNRGDETGSISCPPEKLCSSLMHVWCVPVSR